MTTVSSIETVERPDAPYDLTDEQSEEWWAVVNSMPADWFPRATHADLSNRCRHVVRARKIAQLLDRLEGGIDLDIEAYDRLGKMAERESRIIASLGTKLRITPQTRYDKSKKRDAQIMPSWAHHKK